MYLKRAEYDEVKKTWKGQSSVLNSAPHISDGMVSNAHATEPETYDHLFNIIG